MDKKTKEIGERIKLAKEFPQGLEFLIHAKNDIEELLSLIPEKNKKIEELEANRLVLLSQIYGFERELGNEIEELKEEIKGYKTSLSAELLSLEQRDRIKAEERIKSLEEGIEELIAYGLPKHIEVGLQELLEKKGEPK